LLKLRYLILTIIAVALLAFYIGGNIKTEDEKEVISPIIGNYADESETVGNKKVDRKVIIPVLMYHHFVEEGEETSHTTVTDKAFEEQITYLKSQGFTTITDQDIVDFYYKGKKMPKKPIQITIDDGYESNYKLAYPILKENDMKATIFIIASRIDGEYSLPRLTWEQVKEMSDSGVISIQSHTYDLHHKVTVGQDQVTAAISDHSEEHIKNITDDFIFSKNLIESKLDKEVYSLSYPYGHYDENTISAVEAAGFKLAYTINESVNKFDTNVLELNRINVSPALTGRKIEKEIKRLSKSAR